MDVPSFRRMARHFGWMRKPKSRAPSPRTVRLAIAARERRSPPPPPEPLAPADTPPADVATLVERQLSAIDRILADLRREHGAPPERSARTIASVSRTLKELLRLRAQEAPSAANDDDDDMPTDIDLVPPRSCSPN